MRVDRAIYTSAGKPPGRDGGSLAKLGSYLPAVIRQRLRMAPSGRSLAVATVGHQGRA